MVIAAAPGGVTSNILTKFADGDVALSVSLTAIVSLISILIVPLIVFNLTQAGNLKHIVQGKKIGTLVTQNPTQA